MPRAKKKPKEPRKFTSRSKVTGSSVRASEDFADAAANLKWLVAAGEVIAAQARANASKFSTRIGPATSVKGGDKDNEIVIITDGSKAPNADPNEFGKRHPLNYPNQVNASGGQAWGPKAPNKPKKRPYMAKAMRTSLPAALEVYAQSVDVLIETGLPGEPD